MYISQNVRTDDSQHLILDSVDRRLDQWVSGDQLEELGRQDTEKPSADDNRKLTRNQKRRMDEVNLISQVELDPTSLALEREHQEMTKVKNISCIEIGRYEVDAWSAVARCSFHPRRLQVLQPVP